MVEPTNIVIAPLPDFIINLRDLTVRVGEALTYNPGIALNQFGYQMRVKFDLGAAEPFSEYLVEENAFKVNSNELTDGFIGEYTIQVNATFFNETYQEEHIKEFTLTVL